MATAFYQVPSAVASNEFRRRGVQRTVEEFEENARNGAQNECEMTMDDSAFLKQVRAFSLRDCRNGGLSPQQLQHDGGKVNPA